MGIFSGIGSAKLPTKSTYLGKGRYWIQVMRCKINTNRKHIQQFVMEARIIRVLSDAEVSAHRAGDEATHLVQVSSDYFLGEVKGIIMAAAGVDESDVTEGMCEEVVGEDQPLKGFVLEYNGVEIESKDSTPEKPKLFTRRYYNGRVSAREISETLTDEEKAKYFGASFDWAAQIAEEEG